MEMAEVYCFISKEIIFEQYMVMKGSQCSFCRKGVT